MRPQFARLPVVRVERQRPFHGRSRVDRAARRPKCPGVGDVSFRRARVLAHRLLASREGLRVAARGQQCADEVAPASDETRLHLHGLEEFRDRVAGRLTLQQRDAEQVAHKEVRRPDLDRAAQRTDGFRGPLGSEQQLGQTDVYLGVTRTGLQRLAIVFLRFGAASARLRHLGQTEMRHGNPLPGALNLQDLAIERLGLGQAVGQAQGVPQSHRDVGAIRVAGQTCMDMPK